jgi:SpoVK/Ycf46/Vps4 family AAA+-type ATPase
MYMFQREQLFTKTDVANYTIQAAEKMFEFENKTFFWTKHQKALIDTSPKRVLFTSEFGTGKTTLLKAKAKQLGKERYLQQLKIKYKKMESSPGKIYLVIFTGQEAFLPQSLKVEFEELAEHVEILTLISK